MILKLGVMVIALYPLLTAFLFAVIYILYQYLYAPNGAGVFRKRQSYLYVVFLCTASMPILFISVRAGIIWDILGVLPSIHIYTALLVAISFLAGRSLYDIERKVVAFLMPLLSKVVSKKDEQTTAATSTIANKGMSEWIAFSIVTALLEEFMWRGFLMTTFVDVFQWSSFNSMVLSALLFGINHYYFGVQNVLLKIISGYILAGIYIATPSLLYPMIAHTVFNIRVYQRRAVCANT